jgi:hypothetical protein
MSVSNEEIMRKLDKIESMLTKVLEEEDVVIENEEKELKTIRDSNLNLEFTSIENWREYIWNDCEFKVEKVNGDEVDFWCKKTKSWCRFEGCPLNQKS